MWINSLISDQNEQLPDRDFGLLDVVLALAKNIRQLIFIPLFAGFAVAWLTSMLPKDFTSVTVLNNMNFAGDANTTNVKVTSADVYLKTAAVLDKAAAKLSIAGVSLENRRAALERKIVIVKDRNDPASILSVTSSNPQEAFDISNALIAVWLPSLNPAGTDAARIQARTKSIESVLDQLATQIKGIELDSSSKENAVALVALFTQQRDAERELLKLQESLRPRVVEDVVISGPTFPDEGQSRFRYLAPILGCLAFILIAGLSVLRSSEFAILRSLPMTKKSWKYGRRLHLVDRSHEP